MTIGTSIWISRSAVAVESAGARRLVCGRVRRGVRRGIGRRSGGVRFQDRARIRRVDRRNRACLLLVDALRWPVLDVRDRGVIGVGGEPVVNELLDDPAPSKRRTDVVPASLALEVAKRLRIAFV